MTGDTDCQFKALTGDVDRTGVGAGTVTIGDALRVNRGFHSCNPCLDPACVEGDIDLNGIITIGDALTVNRLFNGTTASCP